MRRHLEAMQTRWYGALVEKFNHRYPLRSYRSGCITLELGAGIGGHLCYEDILHQTYYANEFLPELCDKIKEKYPTVTTISGDCQCRLPLPDAYFDRILAIHVLEHLPNLPATLQEVYRLLKGNGYFSVVIPCEGGLAYTLARNISARPHFEKTYGQSYDWFIKHEHINLPGEILKELNELFEVRHKSYFPLIFPSVTFNLAIGLTLSKK